MKIEENIPLANLTTFEIGGDARYFADVRNSSELGIALDYAQTRRLQFFILGGGSNVLISDSGFDGLIIKISFAQTKINVDTGEVYAEAGSNLMELIKDIATYGLSGMENLYGIPGTVGGAVRGNAGAFGTEIENILENVTALNVETREIKTLLKTDCKFGYRSSIFKENTEWIILSATFRLKFTDKKAVLWEIKKILELREEKQIQNIKSAGSYFLNPVVSEVIRHKFEDEKGMPARKRKVPAGWLIEKSGLKGKCVGDLCTGEKSANYFINKNKATSDSVIKLATKVKRKVFDDFGVELTEEVVQVGFLPF